MFAMKKEDDACARAIDVFRDDAHREVSWSGVLRTRRSCTLLQASCTWLLAGVASRFGDHCDGGIYSDHGAVSALREPVWLGMKTIEKRVGHFEVAPAESIGVTASVLLETLW